MAAPPSAAVAAVLATTLIFVASRVEGSWCVARSDASEQALQAGLDYACGFGADCAPILSNGLCYLPNTLLAHASYAYDSYYQRKGRAPGSCDFAGTANIAKTDPSYGSCVYPSRPRIINDSKKQSKPNKLSWYTFLEVNPECLREGSAKKTVVDMLILQGPARLGAKSKDGQPEKCLLLETFPLSHLKRIALAIP